MLLRCLLQVTLNEKVTFIINNVCVACEWMAHVSGREVLHPPGAGLTGHLGSLTQLLGTDLGFCTEAIQTSHPWTT